MSSGSNQNPNRRSRAIRDYEVDFPPLPSGSQRLASLPMLRNLHPGRPSFRRIPSSERRERYMSHLIGRVTSHSDEFEELNHSLEEANANLRALLDVGGHGLSIPHAMPPTMSGSPPPPHRAQDHVDESRRKRRKIDSERQVPNFKSFSYGRYGQVEPGTLTMEIVSCDGGMFLNDAVYAAENILKNDGTVYCTKGTRCNIVLRHQGATVFNLTELVIKAPGAHYSSPVREGMVFVSMNKDELLNRTAEYQIQYAPRSQRHVGSQDDEQSNDDYWRSRSARWRRIPQAARRGEALLDITAMDDEDDIPDPQEAQMPREFTSSAVPPFRVTTECSEDEGDHRLSAGIAPLRIGSLPFERDAFDTDSSDSGYRARGDDPWELELLTGRDRDRDRDREREMERLRTRESSLSEALAASQVATQDAVRAVGGELMAPHAKFHIDMGRTKCTIRFDPPVSGRFILLKMWSPRPDPTSNIDIQAVMAKGFAGPRYFPAVSLR